MYNVSLIRKQNLRTSTHAHFTRVTNKNTQIESETFIYSVIRTMKIQIEFKMDQQSTSKYLKRYIIGWIWRIQTIFVFIFSMTINSVDSFCHLPRHVYIKMGCYGSREVFFPHFIDTTSRYISCRQNIHMMWRSSVVIEIKAKYDFSRITFSLLIINIVIVIRRSLFKQLNFLKICIYERSWAPTFFAFFSLPAYNSL